MLDISKRSVILDVELNKEIMKEQLLELQKQRDFLRSQLKGQSKKGQFGEQFELDSEKLKKLDGLFRRLCSSQGFQLSKFGRLL